MLGSDVSRELVARGLAGIGSDQEIDITDPAVMREFVRGRDIRWIVNCGMNCARTGLWGLWEGDRQELPGRRKKSRESRLSM